MTSTKTVRGATRIRGFDDPEFDFQLLRSMGATATGGGAVGECLAVAGRTADGDPASWVENFTSVAETVIREARRCLDQGHAISARDLFCRASMYYRAAEYFEHFDDPNHDSLGLRSKDAFHEACSLFSPRIEVVDIPYSPLALPGYFAPAPHARGRNKTVIILGGFDSSAEELYFQCGVEALRRGFHIFFFDGPGQTGMMRLQPKLPFRPDYEVALRPVLDYMLGRDDVDADRIALVGISFGGYLAPRCACNEHRVKALIANSPVTDWGAYMGGFFGPGGMEEPDFSDEDLAELPAEVITPRQKQMTLHCFRKFGTKTWHTFLKRIADFRLTPEMMAAIECPVLACLGEGEGEEPMRQYEEFANEVSGPVTRHLFGVDWGADSHCQLGNLARFGQVVYDWLDDLFDSTR